MRVITPFWAYQTLAALLVALILITPYLAFQKNAVAGFLYNDAFAQICHQKISRSLCLFQENNSYSIGDCTPQNETYREDTRAEKTAVIDGVLGYKFPVSARDLLIYVGMFVGGFVLLLAGRADSTEVPSIVWFVLALVPIAIDGTTQLAGWRESTNVLRMITGFIAGFAVGIYAPLLLNNLFSRKR